MMSPQDPPRNRLASERSPYLRQHADNPVDWYPWGEEAFRRAREEDKPIFLSIGYSTCHWCHVMEEESFMNPGIARILNEEFVAIKADREEHPDLDHLYMTYVQTTTGHGGWPLSVWLTPEREPFLGATYFPPDQFRQVLQAVAGAWERDRDHITATARRAVEHLRQSERGRTTGAIAAAQLDDACAWFGRTYDPVYGGFGGAPKFPRPCVLLFLLREHVRTGDPRARQMVLETLRAMERGGIHDHVGGGFHRYSVDAEWHVPHFEKMLYDQAQLAIAYLEAYQLTGDRWHASMVRETLDYVLDRLTHPEGGFFSAEDADTEHVEGATYVWTRAEIEQVLGPDAAEFFRRYDVGEDGNVPPHADARGELTRKNVLRRIPDVEPMPQALARLRLARSRRPQPHRDEKVIVAWNGWAISALARSGAVLEEPRYLRAATSAARFVEEHLAPDGSLRRYWREGPSHALAVAADFAALVQALLDLYEAALDDSWLDRALRCQHEMDRLFWDPDQGGYFDSRADADLLVRMKETYDGAEPAANSVAALNLARLEHITGDAGWGERAERTLAHFGGQHPAAAPLALTAAQFRISDPLVIVVDQDASGELTAVVRARFLPNKVLLRPTPLVPWTLPLRSQEPTGYVCHNRTCQRPAHTPAELEERLRTASP